MKKVFLFLSIILFSCKPKIDPVLKPVVEDFMKTSKQYGWDIKNHIDSTDWILVKEDLPVTILGRSIGNSKILINKSIIKDSLLLRAVMYHEMGHNVFDLPHCVCGEFSIMNTFVTNHSHLYRSKKLWNQCVDEMFSQISNKLD